MTIHRLKTWPSHFQAVKDGRKPFELRYGGDRDFAVSDYLVLDEWDPNTGEYNEDEDPLVRLVTYMIDSERYGVSTDYVVMGIRDVTDATYSQVLDRAPERSERPGPRAGHAESKTGGTP